MSSGFFLPSSVAAEADAVVDVVDMALVAAVVDCSFVSDVWANEVAVVAIMSNNTPIKPFIHERDFILLSTSLHKIGLTILIGVSTIFYIPPQIILQRCLFHLFSRKKVSKKRRGDKFSGSPLAVGKTDAFALLLREKVSVS